MGLWGGEEQGYRLRAHVAEQFGDRQTLVTKPAHAKFSAYFNVDNGGGSIRGVYLQGNEAAAPIFRAWMELFSNVGMTTPRSATRAARITSRSIRWGCRSSSSRTILTRGRTTPTWTSTPAAGRGHDEERGDRRVVHAANRDQLLPRKPMPKPATPPPTGSTRQ